VIFFDDFKEKYLNKKSKLKFDKRYYRIDIDWF